VTHTINRHGNLTGSPISTRCSSPADAITESPIDAAGTANPTPLARNNGSGPHPPATHSTANGNTDDLTELPNAVGLSPAIWNTDHVVMKDKVPVRITGMPFACSPIAGFGIAAPPGTAPIGWDRTARGAA
jgi:hypothetical protein